MSISQATTLLISGPYPDILLTNQNAFGFKYTTQVTYARCYWKEISSHPSLIAGHISHSIFWKNLAPDHEGGGEPPKGSLGWAIDIHFGYFEALMQKVRCSAIGVWMGGELSRS
ncbi:Superoxide dismutase [Mn], mitochondrial [Glycine soja]|uniref:superoxide dismutase n=1 Tax=Glycine soja TaxID=3848 RepID=A0A445FE96_GLYSO|nr:Superoxide dismutase [Mn], mitochondrial [Glycine soja]